MNGEEWCGIRSGSWKNGGQMLKRWFGMVPLRKLALAFPFLASLAAGALARLLLSLSASLSLMICQIGLLDTVAETLSGLVHMVQSLHTMLGSFLNDLTLDAAHRIALIPQASILWSDHM
jgi:hypothetical protein